MKSLLIFLLLPIKLFSQDVEGVWTGTLYHDTIKKYFPYEIAITENNGKLSGFSHTIFIDENNISETGVKKLKVKKKGDKILIEDDELIYDNYTVRPPKGVRQYCVLSLIQSDSGFFLIGAFNTNRTKDYSSATGTIHLQRKNKIAETKIIPKLEEMNLASSLSFIQNKPKEEVAIVPVNKITQTNQPQQQEKDVAKISLPDIKKEKISTANEYKTADNILIVFKEDTIKYKPDVVKSKDKDTVEKQNTNTVNTPTTTKEQSLIKAKQQTVVAPATTKPPQIVQPKNEVVNIPVRENKNIHALPQSKEKTVTTSISQAIKKTEPIPQQKIINNENANTQVVIKKPVDSSLQKQKPDEAIVTSPKPLQKSVLTPTPPIYTAELANRQIETIKTVEFKSDSLTLTLYDNGIVDGDTVSVLLNGKNIMPHQGLSTKAINKTIYITPDLGDSLQLIMYAENLGSIPPNTGLLIIHDGEDIYQIRFAGDLQKNAAIILRRKVNSH